jgi:hypothetical protein
MYRFFLLFALTGAFPLEKPILFLTGTVDLSGSTTESGRFKSN